MSWLDHVVCTGTAHRHVLSCDTLDDITFGDHIPVRIVYYFKQGDHVQQSHSNDEVEDSVPHVNWSSASDAQILEYKKLTNLLLGRIDVNKDAFKCCELNCSNVEHRHEIDCVYTQIIHALHDSGAKCIGVGKCKRNWDGMTMLLNFTLMQEIVT